MSIRNFVPCCVILVLLSVTPFVAVHASIIYVADLSGLAEAPANASPGTGSASVEYDAVAHTLKVDAAFTGLMGDVSAAHIHCCTALAGTGTAGVASTTPTLPGFPSGVTSGVYSQLFDLTNLASFNMAFVNANGGSAAGAEVALAAGLANGLAYFNIHTTSFAGGEIRGFLAPVPVPAALWLFGSGLLGLLAVVRGKAVA